MRSIWKGSLGFGLVNIPVKMFSAVQESSLNLDMLDKKDHSNIKFKRVNESTGREVAWGNIVKGYLMNDRYVVLEKEDFEKAAPEKTNMISIEHFADEKEIDSSYFESPYFLEPEKSGTRAYCLLREALEKTGMAGIAEFVMHNREYVCMVRATDKMLMLHRLRFAHEIRSADDLAIPHIKSKPAELKMAMDLVKKTSRTFNIDKYKDDYTGQLLKIIKAKAKGKKTTFKPMKVVHTKSKDLMEQLKASLGKKMAS